MPAKILRSPRPGLSRNLSFYLPQCHTPLRQSQVYRPPAADSQAGESVSLTVPLRRVGPAEVPCTPAYQPPAATAILELLDVTPLRARPETKPAATMAQSPQPVRTSAADGSSVPRPAAHARASRRPEASRLSPSAPTRSAKDQSRAAGLGKSSLAASAPLRNNNNKNGVDASAK